MPVTPYSEPSLQEFVSIKPVPTVSTQVEQGTVIVAPHYDLTDLRDSAGNLNPAAKIGDVKISSLTSKWYASTGMGEAEFPIQSVDSARRVDASTMRVFGAVGTNASLFEITGENDEVVVRTGTASFVYDKDGESSSAGSTIYLVDETANWSSIFTRSQIPFATDPNVYNSEGASIGENPASYPNYNKFMLVVRVYNALVLVGEFAVRPLVLAGSPKRLELIGGPYANSLVYAALAEELVSDVTANRTYELVYKPQLWSIEQAPTAAKARVVSMNRPALSVPEERVRLTLFRHVTGASPSARAVPLVGSGTATLMNVSNSNVTVTVTVTSPAPDPPAPTTVGASGASVTITYGGIATTVAELNDLIVAQYDDGDTTPDIYFDEIGVGGSQVNFATWVSAGVIYYPPATLIVPVYTTHVQGELELNFREPSSLSEDPDGYTVEMDGSNEVEVQLNGRNNLCMTPAGVVSNLFSDINELINDYPPVSGGDLYLKSPFKLLLTDEFLAHTSEWRLLTPAGLDSSDYDLFTVGAAGETSMNQWVMFKPSSFVASIDVVSELLGSLGNRYQIQYRLAYDESDSSITYENETITITQAVSDSDGYLTDILTLNNLVTALNNNPSFVDSNGGRLFDYGNAWSNNGFADNPVPVADLNAPIYPECFASPTDGYYSAPTAAVKVIAPSVNDINLTGGTFRARVKINPLALYSNTSTANASIYVDFRALRLDTTAVTTLSAYGRRPDLVALTRDNYVEVLGPVVPSNPAAIAAHEFYRVGGQRALWFLGVDEIDTTTEGHQYGTPAAIGRAIDLIVRRTGYNIGVLSYGNEIRNLILQKITDLGGTETLRLIKGMDFWIPLKSPDRYPDVLVESSDYVGTGGMGNWVYTTSDFSSNEAAAAAVEDGELFLVVAGDPDASGAGEFSTIYDLGDGKRGWKITSLIAADDPSWVEVDGAFDYVGLDEGDGLLFYRRGFGLITAAGRNMQATAEALSINESAATSMRLMKILGDTATRTINGTEYRLPHELVMVGQTLGLLQQLGPTEPCTGLEYFGIRELTGTNDVFTIPQLDLIRGGGAFIPTQEQAGARRTRVSFDVSSDMTNSYTINRCLHVTDDLLSERIRRRIDPLRSARRVDQLLIDEISLQINTEVESVQRKYEAINLVVVAVLTDEQKVKYGIDARRSGLYVQIYKKHPKISSDLILENIIEF